MSPPRVTLLLLTLAACSSPPPSEPTVEPTCTPGILNCTCARGGVCGKALSGEPLSCAADRCVLSRCPPGGTSCTCAAAETCQSPGDSCRDGFCRPTEGAAGTMGSECVAGTCAGELYCDAERGPSGTCVSATGYPGGLCPPDRVCLASSLCDPASNRCVACNPGDEGCIPDAGRCARGLTLAAGRCVPAAPPVPTNPQCWTRCRANLETPNGVTRCGPDGLMAGCLDGRSCVEGSCVAADESPPTCTGDAQCPDFQSCFGGRCYSGCALDSECGAGRVCHLRVCRLPCQRTSDAQDACPGETFCDASHGTSGVCMPLAPGGSVSPRPVAATFTTSREVVPLRDGPATFSIQHDGIETQSFEVTRVSHRAFDAQGRVLEETHRSDGTPLAFLELSLDGVTQTGPVVWVQVPAECGTRCPVITLTAPRRDPRWAAWEGTLEVKSASLGSRTLRVEQRSDAGGRWAGRAHYFANFPENGLSQWTQAGDRAEASSRVQNGLIRRWGAFRGGRLGGGVRELRAVLNATEEESWRWPSVTRACPQAEGACYLFDPGGGPSSGLSTYVTNLLDAPIPTGHSELEMALHVRTSTGDPRRLVGRVDSRTALHVLGDPAVSLEFEQDPGRPESCGADGIDGACVIYLRNFGSQIVVGGRQNAGPTGLCPSGLDAATHPWLVPGFLRDTTVDPASGSRLRTECRDPRYPSADPARREENRSMAMANPIPDGRARRRTLRLLDGAMIDGQTLFILFEERFESFLDSSEAASFSAYGYLLLERDGSILSAADVNPPMPPAPPAASPLRVGPTCSPELVRSALALPPGGPVPTLSDATQARAVVEYVLAGRSADAIELLPRNVHAYCEDTGLIDGGAGVPRPGSPRDLRVPCPLGSTVRYFAFPTGLMSDNDLANLSCQRDYDATAGTRGSCGAELEAWLASRLSGVVMDPPWSCTGDRRFCDEDRLDLRTNKRFYLPSRAELLPLSAAIDDAFRYRIRFAGRNGASVGFTPDACAPRTSGGTPYCYDAAAVDAIRERVDCLLAIYPSFRGLSSADPHRASADRLQAFLSESFSNLQTQSPNSGNGGIPNLRDGFERLYAELLVMLGDEGYTQAFRSRFDLAALRGAAFQGSAFEPGGIDVSGVAGFELASLYQAAQYYQTALDRFYALAPLMARAIDAGDVGTYPRLITPATITWYLDRLIRASTQRARTWSAIAKRYQDMNRPDLARRVVERAFAGTHLESAVLMRMMVLVERRSAANTRAELVVALEDAQRRYRVALNEMRAGYRAISDQTTLFGYAPDYVPLPVRDDRDFRSSNAFEDVFNTARDYLDTARRLEEVALSSSRDFDVDSASFQAELLRLAESYETRLAPICGQFTGSDGRVYPATARYAYLDPGLAQLSDPCGLVNNGDIFEQLRGMEAVLLRKQLLSTRLENLRAEIDGETERVRQQCSLITSIADFELRQGGRVVDLESQIRSTELVMNVLDRFSSYFSTTLNFIKCSTTSECAFALGQVGYWSAFEIPHIVTAATLQGQINQTQREISEIQLETAAWRTETECQRLQIDSAPLVAAKFRQLAELKLEAQQIMLDLRLAQSRLEELHLEAERIQDEQREAELMTINVAAARNDPNVRIYKNDAIINADQSFQLALRYAYRATKVYEYYTSTSYPRLDQLFLVRMVGRGDYNLDRYMLELRDAFFGFEETFRAPAARVERLSVRDHVFGVPYQDANGAALTVEARNRIFRERLSDARLLDENGHLTIPFATTLDQLAPCTRNHKLDFVEISLVGGSLGDDQANVMLWQKGTGTVVSLDGEDRFYRMPPALLIAQPYFGRTAVFDPVVYRRFELRERPFLNTSWALVLNQRDDRDNQDLDLGQLDDIVIFLYYNDFTDPRSCGSARAGR